LKHLFCICKISYCDESQLDEWQKIFKIIQVDLPHILFIFNASNTSMTLQTNRDESLLVISILQNSSKLHKDFICIHPVLGFNIFCSQIHFRVVQLHAMNFFYNFIQDCCHLLPEFTIYGWNHKKTITFLVNEKALEDNHSLLSCSVSRHFE